MATATSAKTPAAIMPMKRRTRSANFSLINSAGQMFPPFSVYGFGSRFYNCRLTFIRFFFFTQSKPRPVLHRTVHF